MARADEPRFAMARSGARPPTFERRAPGQTSARPSPRSGAARDTCTSLHHLGEAHSFARTDRIADGTPRCRCTAYRCLLYTRSSLQERRVCSTNSERGRAMVRLSAATTRDARSSTSFQDRMILPSTASTGMARALALYHWASSGTLQHLQSRQNSAHALAREIEVALVDLDADSTATLDECGYDRRT